ncbi:MAG: glycosyltransferase family 1 protein [Candidatus Promineifilaceae bacterium]|nr:glycosyltransferase family 1 protein [Candidatus Promineifilaceae bacterium]
MDVKVDGYTFQIQRKGGISRIFTEILPRMCDMDPALEITLFTSGRCQQKIPVHSGIRHRPLFPIDDILRPRRFWGPFPPKLHSLVQWPSLGNSVGAIWHSSYYTRPISWQGAIVVTVYDMIYERFADFFTSAYDERFRQQKKQCILAADKVICISEATLEDVMFYYDIDKRKLEVIPLAHNPVFRPLKTSDSSQCQVSDKPYLLYIGDRNGYKNFRTLLQSYNVWTRRSEFNLVVVGVSWNDRERILLAEFGCGPQVRLLTNIDDVQLAQLYNQAQAFICPSLYEGFGIPLLEAMASGCPVVASRIPSTLEVAGEYPFYFDPQNGAELLASLESALAEGRQSSRIKSAIKHTQRYNWDKTARRTLQVYCSLTTNLQ